MYLRFVCSIISPKSAKYKLKLGISAEVTSIDSWASTIYSEYMLPAFAWRGTPDDSVNNPDSGYFHSLEESNPWLRIQLNRKERIARYFIVGANRNWTILDLRTSPYD